MSVGAGHPAASVDRHFRRIGCLQPFLLVIVRRAGIDRRRLSIQHGLVRSGKPDPWPFAVRTGLRQPGHRPG
jgi:hypothetical protein